MTKQFILALASLLSISAVAQNWTNYTTKNSNLTGDNILAITADNRGTLWVGTTQGLNSLKNGTWTDYSDFNEKLKNQFVNCLVSEGNTLWIGTDDYGVIEFNGNRWFEHSEETRRLNMKYIRDIAVDHAGTKWIGVTLSGFVSYDGVNRNKYTAAESGLLSDFILCVVVDNRDRKWIGTNDGLCLLDGSRWTSYTTRNSKLPNNNILSIAIDRDNSDPVRTYGTRLRISDCIRKPLIAVEPVDLTAIKPFYLKMFIRHRAAARQEHVMGRIHLIAVFPKFIVQLYKIPQLKKAVPLRISDQPVQKSVEARLCHDHRVPAQCRHLQERLTGTVASSAVFQC